MDAGFEARLQTDGASFEAADAALLRAVDEHRSLNAAADALGRSFSRAHKRITVLEDEFGELVERQRGGVGGGGSELTDAAHDLIARFDRLQTAYTGTATVEETVLRGRIVDRDGELATVETAAGTVRALAPEASERVQVTLRADAVTLHAPDDIPETGEMSARNRFRGTVVDLDHGETIVRVGVDIGARESLAVLVTHDALAALDLVTGDSVVTSFKATATRATAAD
ncbi:TOBE domain-containing protein [Halococcus saccharolyticus]|uniref:Transcriptional regulator, ModE family protein n=1 Tax=Halococcus saccharolyticus DSM 5350 TaxID=1227455 RepID=M0MDR1_9EURY|nr:TOBE domain-containing protein [Halococcus saccharolyticus]EMA43897.1 transcriptional regulator, ModE family protein [Halococcus saccharolyticus DSM 5350]